MSPVEAPRRRRMSLKCNYCKTNWPDSEDYEHCPRCLEPTKKSSLEPIPSDEAIREKRHMEFGWWLWDTGRL